MARGSKDLALQCCAQLNVLSFSDPSPWICKVMTLAPDSDPGSAQSVPAGPPSPRFPSQLIAHLPPDTHCLCLLHSAFVLLIDKPRRNSPFQPRGFSSEKTWGRQDKSWKSSGCCVQSLQNSI